MDLCKNKLKKKYPSYWITYYPRNCITTVIYEKRIFEITRRKNPLFDFFHMREDHTNYCCFKKIFLIVNQNYCCYQCGLKKNLLQRFSIKELDHKLLIHSEAISENKQNSEKCFYCNMSLWCVMSISQCKVCEDELYEYSKTIQINKD